LEGENVIGQIKKLPKNR